jgi:glutathione S-transferase
MTTQYPIILHHFDPSPFSEKIRLVFGYKSISWHSVQIPRILPRPNLMPLTGGYRRTPTMQIGADIYCDTQIIIRELERRFPTPTLFPGGNAGVPWALTMWTDRIFFMNNVKISLGARGDAIPREFLADRERLFDAPLDIAGMRAAMPQSRDQFRAHIGWIEAQLEDGRPWLLGDGLSLADISAYMIVWHLRTSLTDAAIDVAGLEPIFRSAPRTLAWERRIKAIEHGTRAELSEEEALTIAAVATPQTPVEADPGDPNGRKPGDRVSIVPDDYGKVEVTGTIVSLSAQHIAIARRESGVGDIVVHFPRAGFAVIPV